MNSYTSTKYDSGDSPLRHSGTSRHIATVIILSNAIVSPKENICFSMVRLTVL